MFARFLLLFLLVLALPVHGQQKKESRVPTHGLLWEVSGNGLKEPSYLFGTYHLLDKSFIDTMPHLLSRLMRAKQVVGEMVIDSMNNLLGGMMMAVMQNTMLNDLLSPEDYQLVAAEFKRTTGFSIEMVRMFKPMTIYIMLYGSKAKKAAAGIVTVSPEDMIDVYIQRDARSLGKPVIGLETLEDQMHALFDQFSLKRQAEMLVELVKDTVEDDADFKKITDCYFAEDLSCLKEMLSKEEVDPLEMRGLLDDRNTKWLKLLPKIMKERSSFIAVGALHLAGYEGLVAQLRKRGYRVERVAMH
jgi:uncharacterized protein YbaP (TraB family)